MFCSKCGNEIKGIEKFCPKCGTPVQQQKNFYQQGAGKTVASKRPPYLAIGVILILAVIVVMIVRSCAASSYKTPIKKMFQAIEKQDGEKLLSLYPKEVIDDTVAGDGIPRSLLVADLEYRIVSSYPVDEADYDFSYEIVGVKDYSLEDVKELEEDINSSYGCDLEMENAKEVTVEITETEDGDVEQEEQDIIVIKTDGKWCLHPDETDF